MTIATEKSSQKFSRRRDGWYFLPGDKKYASVTTILDVLAKPALINWAAKTAASLVLADPDEYDSAQKAAAGIYQVRDRAADRGSMVHSMIEALFRGAPVETDSMPEHVRGYYAAFWSWVAATQPKPVYAETNVYSDKHGYAGTLDLIAAFPDKKLKMKDFKTSSGIYPEMGLQLEAYRNCDFILPRGQDPTPIPMPPVAETGIVLLMPDGTYMDRPMRGDLEVFLALKRVWEWSKSSGR